MEEALAKTAAEEWLTVIAKVNREEAKPVVYSSRPQLPAAQIHIQQNVSLTQAVFAGLAGLGAAAARHPTPIHYLQGPSPDLRPEIIPPPRMASRHKYIDGYVVENGEVFAPDGHKLALEETKEWAERRQRDPH